MDTVETEKHTNLHKALEQAIYKCITFCKSIDDADKYSDLLYILSTQLQAVEHLQAEIDK